MQLAEGAETVAGERRRRACRPVVGPAPEGVPGEARRGLGHALDEAEHGDRRAEHDGHEEREQRIDHLRAQVGDEADRRRARVTLRSSGRSAGQSEGHGRGLCGRPGHAAMLPPRGRRRRGRAPRQARPRLGRGLHRTCQHLVVTRRLCRGRYRSKGGRRNRAWLNLEVRAAGRTRLDGSPGPRPTVTISSMTRRGERPAERCRQRMVREVGLAVRQSGGRRLRAAAALASRALRRCWRWPWAPPAQPYGSRRAHPLPALPGRQPLEHASSTPCPSTPTRPTTSPASAPTGACTPTSAPSGTARPIGIPYVVVRRDAAQGAHLLLLRRRERPRSVPDPPGRAHRGRARQRPATATCWCSTPTTTCSTRSTTRTQGGRPLGRPAREPSSTCTSNALRPDGWTSADAAGLPILPGLVRYDEVAAGVIDHALRFTVDADAARLRLPGDPLRQRLHRPRPAAHGPAPAAQGRLRHQRLPACDVQVILQALKTYGMIVADNGSRLVHLGRARPALGRRRAARA